MRNLEFGMMGDEGDMSLNLCLGKTEEERSCNDWGLVPQEYRKPITALDIIKIHFGKIVDHGRS